MDSGSDLFVYKAPEIPTSKIYTIRPYLFEDEMATSAVCRKTCLEGNDGSHLFSDHPDLPCDR